MATLNIGAQSFDSQDLAVDVEQDIHFLRERITQLEQQQAPNPAVLQTYRGMLESRQALHDWLLQKEARLAVTQSS